MRFVRGLGALLTHARVFVPAVRVQQTLVFLAHLVFQVVYGIQQLVSAQRLSLLVVSQVRFAEGARAVQTRLHGLHLPPDAGVAGYVARFGEVSPVIVLRCSRRVCQAAVGSVTSGGGQTLELLGDLGQHAVDAELGFFGEGFLAHGAEELLAVVPEALKTRHAEGVTAGSGDGLHEHLQTDGTGELLL